MCLSRTTEILNDARTNNRKNGCRHSHRRKTSTTSTMKINDTFVLVKNDIKRWLTHTQLLLHSRLWHDNFMFIPFEYIGNWPPIHMRHIYTMRQMLNHNCVISLDHAVRPPISNHIISSGFLLGFRDSWVIIFTIKLSVLLVDCCNFSSCIQFKQILCQFASQTVSRIIALLKFITSSSWLQHPKTLHNGCFFFACAR